ncbi:AMP-binding protein, partial [Streptomyces sp. WAC05950]
MCAVEAEPKLVEPVRTVVDGVVREVRVPALAAAPAQGSLGDIPFDNAAQAPNEAVLARKEADGTWRDVTAAEFAAEVLAVARGLIAEGLREGDRLAIMARTTYEWTLLDFAGWAAGLVTVPIYPTSSALQARWIIQDSGAVACAVEDTAQARIISAERANLPWLAHLWEFDTGAIGRLVKAGERIPEALVHARRANRTPDSVATLIYTSGT